MLWLNRRGESARSLQAGRINRVRSILAIIALLRTFRNGWTGDRISGPKTVAAPCTQGPDDPISGWIPS